MLRPFRSSLLVFNDSAPNLEIGQYLNQIYRMDYCPPGGANQLTDFGNQFLHSVTSRNIPIIRLSTAASSASISASGRGGRYLKNSRLKLIS